ncbi:MAG: tubulin-like doman-containing protein [Chloroflexi bacterium]|nr:tubulin-like doman-containing protein [Chloroflexota bacterium]
MTTEIRFEPTLFVFLGTSSGQIGWRLKELMRRAYGDIPVLRFLWVDADSTMDPYAAAWFSPMERAELTGFNGDAVLANLNNYPAIKDWWPRDSRLRAGFINRGAGQMRPVGRLALFRMYNDRDAGPAFIDKLRVAAESIQQIENIDATERMSSEKMRFIVERGSVRVVIIYSTCGGTGSSMTFDIAYLCRHLLRDANPTMMAIALLPSIMDKAIKNETAVQRERIRANTYAWFKECNYLLENPHWHVAYPEGAPLSIEAMPFDMTFVVELGNQAGNRLNSEDDIYNMVASAVFLDTGSSIGGAIRGFNANVSVLLEEFKGKRRAFSSLAAASLIYPAEKVLGHCGARLGQAMIRQGCLAQPDKEEVEEAASALLGRLQLRDAQLLENLLSDQHVSNLNVPAIRKAGEVEEIRRLLAMQEEGSAKEREYLKGKIADKAVEWMAQAQKALQAEIAALAVERGARFAQAVLERLTAEASTYEQVAESTCSLAGLKVRLSQQGISEANLSQAEKEYQKGRERLRGMAGDALRSAQRTLFKKGWQEELNRARNDCLTWMAEIDRCTLQLHAQRQAANIYDQLGEQARQFKSTLAGVLQSLERAVGKLEERADENLKPSTAEKGIYELNVEAVDASYIRDYYQKRAASLNPAAAYRSFAQRISVSSLDTLAAWGEAEWADQMQQHGQTFFAEELENTSLLKALTDYHGQKAPRVIAEKLDRLVRYCHPFWQYDANSGIQGQEGKSIIGVEDEHSDLIPPKYRQDPQYEVKSTGFKHRIDFARVQHGLPAFLLRDMADYKTCYEAKRKGLDPLHTFPQAFQADEVMPEEKQEARNLFAVAAAFGYIVQIGSFYYFDARKEHEALNIHPGRENRLDQGREKAEDAFTQRDDLIRLAEQLIEKDIVNMGNQAAIKLLEERVVEYKQALARMTPENELRRQYEEEIRALQAKQEQLGKL